MSSRSLIWLAGGLAAGLLWTAPAHSAIDQRDKAKGGFAAGLRQAGCAKPARPAPGCQGGKVGQGGNRKPPAKPPIACGGGGKTKPGGFQQGFQQVCQRQGGNGKPGQQCGNQPRKPHGPKKGAVACGQPERKPPKPGGFNQGLQQVGCGNKDKGPPGKPGKQPGQCVGKPKKKGPPQLAFGNNGVGNGMDPQPPGNPPINDGAGAFPGQPGNRGGPKKGAGFVGFAPGKMKGPKPKK